MKSSIRKAKRILLGQPMPKGLRHGFCKEGLKKHLPDVYERTAELLKENSNVPPAMLRHYRQLLPCIAFYEAAKKLLGASEAIAFMERWTFTEVKKPVPFLRFVMRLGLYRKMPQLCEWMLHQFFNTDAGFESRPVLNGREFSVDIVVCPYVEACNRYGCPEITRFSCEADDLLYGNLHPKLLWARTQTLGKGGTCCDFRLHLKEHQNL